MSEKITPPDGSAPSAAPAKARRRQPRKVTPQYLENAALHYLERFATSAENLRRVLMRKVARSTRAHGTDPEEGERWVEALVARYREAGLLDDAAYAAMKARSLNRQGGSTRAIRAKLAVKGVAAETVEAAVEDLREDVGDPDLAAAVALARRRGFGPFRRPGLAAKRLAPEDRRAKELAAMARAGFRFDLAVRVIDADDPEDLEPQVTDG